MFETQHRGNSAAARPLLRWLAVAALCALAGCIYDVPITASGNRNIDAKLLGDWHSKDGKEQLKSYCHATGAPLALWSNGRDKTLWHRKNPNYFVEIPELPTATQSIADVAEQEGMRRLREDGMAKVAGGVTSLAEVTRVTGR